MSNNIGILGCGWLGLPLAESFLKDGYKVYGTTTSEEKLLNLEQKGISPFLVSFSENGVKGNITGFLSQINMLIINIPPKLRGENKENYVQKMTLLHQSVKAANITKIIFVSSTSIYGDISGKVTEMTTPKPVSDSGKQLLISEELFVNDPSLKTTIVRFGGLIGKDRHPAHFLSGRKGISNGSDPINLIHLDDCIRIIKAIIENAWWNETFNGVYPLHSSKKEYYTTECIKKGLPIPSYEGGNSQGGKCIQSHNLLHEKSFRFKTSIIS